jgi:hypothetical protein
VSIAPARIDASSSRAAMANANGTQNPTYPKVQHRRMDDHPRILQQRVQVAPFNDRRPATGRMDCW